MCLYGTQSTWAPSLVASSTSHFLRQERSVSRRQVWRQQTCILNRGSAGHTLQHLGNRSQRAGRNGRAHDTWKVNGGFSGGSFSCQGDKTRAPGGYRHQGASQDLRCRRLSFLPGPSENCGRRAVVPQPDSRWLTVSQAVDASYQVLATGGRVVSDVLPLGLMPVVHRLSQAIRQGPRKLQ